MYSVYELEVRVVDTQGYPRNTHKLSRTHVPGTHARTHQTCNAREKEAKNMYVCMYECMYLRMYVCMYVCICVCVCVCARARACV